MSTPSFATTSSSSQSSLFAEGSQKRRLSSPTSSFEEETGQSPKKRRHVVHVVPSDSDEVEVETVMKLNARQPAPRTYVPIRRVRERPRGTRHVPIARTTPVNVQRPPSVVPPDQDMRSTTPPRAPPQTTAPPSTSKRRKSTVRSILTSAC
jgi:hypothetical protein